MDFDPLCQFLQFHGQQVIAIVMIDSGKSQSLPVNARCRCSNHYYKDQLSVCVDQPLKYPTFRVNEMTNI